jgi:hypothetical protein
VAIRKASEIKEGDVILGRRAGPLVARADSTATRYRGKQEGWRIKVGDGYPTIVVPGDPDIPIADDPEDAWNEHVQIRNKL